MRWFGYILMFIIGAIAADILHDAVRNKVNETIENTTKLVMFSSPLCAYCTYFEQNVAPIYKRHSLSDVAPLHAVNMDEEGSGPYHLEKPIEVLPTFIVIKDGKEVGRLTGIPDKFYFLTFIRDHVM